MILTRGLHLWAARRHHTDSRSTLPPFYVRHTRIIWLSTALIIVVAYAWNTHAAVYVTGVNPRIVLPFKLNIVLAWCYIMAFPLWVAILVGWELERRHTRRIGWLLLSAPVGEAILNAGSLLSRATYLLRVAAYFLAATRPDSAGGTLQFPRPRILTLSVLGLGFAASIAAVMAFRTMIYFGPAPSVLTAAASPPAAERASPMATSPTSDSEGAAGERGVGRDSTQTGEVPGAAQRAASTKSVLELRPVGFIVQEVGTLFLDRWTGLEGVLAVTAAPQNLSVLKAVITEDPALGTESIYQEVARARYEAQERFTFLTLAGVIAILAMGGSPWLLVAGMAAISSVLMLSESCIRRITRNEMACSVVAMTSAFMAAQVTFPKLFAVFLLELVLTLGALAALFWILSRLEDRPARAPGPGELRST